MLDLPLELLARVMDARLQGAREAAVMDVAIDSRRVKPGDLFVAVTGERVDGHRFVAQALEAGAAAALVAPDRLTAAERSLGPLLLTPDPVEALGRLAAWHRNRFAIPVVAVTGSLGKTTTKDYIAGVLSQQWETLKSPGNLNTEIGLPLALLQLRRTHQAAVMELGMRGEGQIRYLARLVRPQIAVITNIGLSHVEVLGSQEAIAAAKAEVLDFLPEGGTAVLNTDDAFTPFLRSRVPRWASTSGYGFSLAGGPDVTGVYSGVTRDDHRPPRWGSRLLLMFPGARAPERLLLPVLGRHNAANALAAVAVGRALGIRPTRIRHGLAGVELSGQRMEVLDTHFGVILDDSYNASSPEAMEGALEVLGEVRDARQIAVLGDMLELGEHSAANHERVGAAVGRLKPALLVTVGEQAALIAARARQDGVETRVCDSCEAAVALLQGTLRAGDVTLVKGSRGMQMERIVRALRGLS
jgi:UDP-N-acetylmuramoyl-tripeptide--D-alanyl-D-alanine ligase